MSVTPIAEQVHTMRTGRPAEPPSAFDLEQQDLEGFIPEDVIAPGRRLPDAELLDAHGVPTTLLAALDGRPAVLVFYREHGARFASSPSAPISGAACPRSATRGVALVAVEPAEARRVAGMMKEKNELTYTVLSDPHNTLATGAGILTAPSDGARAAQLELGST